MTSQVEPLLQQLCFNKDIRTKVFHYKRYKLAFVVSTVTQSNVTQVDEPILSDRAVCELDRRVESCSSLILSPTSATVP